MADDKKILKKKGERPIYTPPKIIRLDDLHIGIAAGCAPNGGSPVAGVCETFGSGAAVSCNVGAGN